MRRGDTRTKAVRRLGCESRFLLAGVDIWSGRASLGPVQCDALMYDVLVLRAGQIGQSFSGLISPRPSEFQQALEPPPDLWGIKFRRWRRWY